MLAGGIAGRALLQQMPRQVVFCCPNAISLLRRGVLQDNSNLCQQIEHKISDLEECVAQAEALEINVDDAIEEYLQVAKSRFGHDADLNDTEGLQLDEKVFNAIAPRTMLVVRDFESF